MINCPSCYWYGVYYRNIPELDIENQLVVCVAKRYLEKLEPPYSKESCEYYSLWCEARDENALQREDNCYNTKKEPS
jgi:hypothetical protein